MKTDEKEILTPDEFQTVGVSVAIHPTTNTRSDATTAERRTRDTIRKGLLIASFNPHCENCRLQRDPHLTPEHWRRKMSEACHKCGDTTIRRVDLGGECWCVSCLHSRVNGVEELLADIYDWMMENDYECGPQGQELYLRIRAIIKPKLALDTYRKISPKDSPSTESTK